MVIQVQLFRQHHRDGTSQDWAVPVNLEGSKLPVYFGRTGSTLRLTETPAHRCRDGSPFREAEVRIREKEAKGYQDLGVFLLSANRRNLTPTSPGNRERLPDAAAGDPATPVPALYWRWRSAELVETARRQAFATACTEAVARLAAVGWTLPGCSPDPQEGLAIWSSVTQDAHHGVVPLTEAHKPFIAFLLSLARRGIDLTVANEQGQIITTWPPELPMEAEILEVLGLKPKDWSPWLAGSGGDWFF